MGDRYHRHQRRYLRHTPVFGMAQDEINKFEKTRGIQAACLFLILGTEDAHASPNRHDRHSYVRAIKDLLLFSIIYAIMKLTF